jgi:hypothetical protein
MLEPKGVIFSLNAVNSKRSVDEGGIFLTEFKNSLRYLALEINIKTIVLVAYFSLFLSSSLCARSSTHDVLTLTWDKVEGSQYEIEVSKNDNSNVILQKIVEDAHFDLEFQSPGTYFARVRQVSNGRKGPFSEYSKITVRDKIELIKKPLMNTAKETVIKESSEYVSVKLKIDRPFQDFKYFLEIWDKTKTKILRKEEIKGSHANFRSKNLPSTYYWRAYAKSPHGKESRTDEFFKISIHPLRKKPKNISVEMSSGIGTTSVKIQGSSSTKLDTMLRSGSHAFAISSTLDLNQKIVYEISARSLFSEFLKEQELKAIANWPIGKISDRTLGVGYKAIFLETDYESKPINSNVRLNTQIDLIAIKYNHRLLATNNYLIGTSLTLMKAPDLEKNISYDLELNATRLMSKEWSLAIKSTYGYVNYQADSKLGKVNIERTNLSVFLAVEKRF